MKLFRKIVFWLHLIAGLVAGLSIGIMCFTGTALAFEKELVAWAQRDVRQIPAPAENATRLTLEQLQAKVREAQPEARPTSIVIQNNPRAAVAFPAGGRGGAGGFYANPYTGEVRPAQPSAASSFMQTMTAWHRYLNFTGEVSRPRGKLINGVCNLAFCALALTGLYLWLPRSWSWRALKPVIWFRQNSSSKARDFNWHNTIGFWSAPVLIVLTLTAIPISFQWGGRVINSLTGTPQPVAGASGGPGAATAAALPPVTIAPPAEGIRPLSQDALVTLVQKEIPSWKTITIGGAAGRGERGPVTPAGLVTAAPAAFTVRASDSWPRTANITLTLNPYTGETLRRTGYADQAPAQRVRAWTRFLHTGEALGFWGQLVAGVACLGGCVLVYTGFALSWRRFFGGKSDAPSIS